MLTSNRMTDGFGTVSQEELDSLIKSLSTGNEAYNAAPSTLTQGTALMTQSLDSSLKAVTFGMKHLKLWPMFPKDKAFNTVEEYNRQTSYGETSNGGFFNADTGTAPDEQTSAYNREVEVVRYMGTTRVVTHPLTLIRPAHGPIVAREIKNGTMYILQNLERQLFEAKAWFEDNTGTFKGDPADMPTNSAKFKGLDAAIRFGDNDTKAQYTGFEPYGGTRSVIQDLVGNTPDENALENLCNRTLENFGMPTDLFIDNQVWRDLNVLFYPKERVVPMGPTEGKAGFVITQFVSSAGPIAIQPDVFLRPKFAPISAQPNAPATPVVGGSGTEVDATSLLPTGTFHYRVSAVNNSGESAATADFSQAVVAGNRITITINAGTAGALYYAVYRSTSATGHTFIGYIKDSNANGAGGATFRDAGKKQPGLPSGYLLSLNSDDLTWKQLAPLMKMDLAITGPAYRWMQLLYGTPIVFAPLHHAILDNIGRQP